jgi:hypothetical protein
MANTSELDRVITLADEVAEQIIASLDSGTLTTGALRTSREVALVAEVAAILEQAAVALPPGICRLGMRAAEQLGV